MVHMKFLAKQKEDSDTETNLWIPKRKSGAEMNWEIGLTHTVLHYA